MTEREFKLLLNEGAVRQVHLNYGMMTKGYMVIVNNQSLETNKREVREFKTLDAAANLLFKMGIANFVVKLNTVKP